MPRSVLVVPPLLLLLAAVVGGSLVAARIVAHQNDAAANSRGATAPQSLVAHVPLMCVGGYMWATPVLLGTPARSFWFTVDTGSSDFVIVSANCPAAVCGVAPAGAYNVSASRTAAPVTCRNASSPSGLNATCAMCAPRTDQCGNAIDYGGSIVEDYWLGTDVAGLHVHLPSNPAADVIQATAAVGATYNINFTSSGPMLSNRGLGGVHQLIGQRRNGISSSSSDINPPGMWGMAFTSLASSHAPTFFDALVAQHKGLIADRFALSLSYTGGALTLGGASQPEANFTFVPLVEPFDFYRVRALDVLVNGASLGLPPSTYNGPCIVDSGTPTPTLPTAAFAALSAVLRGYCTNATLPALHGVCDVAPNASVVAGGTCYEYSEAQIVAFPTIEFVVQTGADAVANTSLRYRPTDYLVPQYYCATPMQRGFALVEDRHFTVLGASLMTQFDVLFDRANKRVGFAPKRG